MPIPHLVDLPNVAYPVLPQGIHEATLDEIEARFVAGFTPSHRRAKIFTNFKAFRQEVMAVLNVRAIYLDGSFVTGKPDPKDVDVSVWAHADDINSLAGINQARLNRALADAKSKKLDAYVVPECEMTHPLRRVFETMLWTEHYWTICRDANGLTLSPHESRKGYLKVAP